MGVKLDSFAENKAAREVPGPGFYSLKQTEVKNSGKYVLSNFMYIRRGNLEILCLRISGVRP
jgi:hypothetical protein